MKPASSTMTASAQKGYRVRKADPGAHTTRLAFEGYILKEGRRFVSICPDLDVASFGKTEREARDALIEACRLYLEAAIERNLPYIRPMPDSQHPRHEDPCKRVAQFTLSLDVMVSAHA